jgi:predicted house-cleaning noncanonical NTP pyrophosphatase (MazG superfamily)
VQHHQKDEEAFWKTKAKLWEEIKEIFQNFEGVLM